MITINGTMWVQILNFLILVAVLAKFCYKPILNVMKARQERIANDLENAAKAKEAAEASRKEYEAQLANARREAQTIIDKAVKQADVNTQAQLSELRTQLAREKEQARLDILQEREKAMRELRQDMVSLSIAMAGKVVARDMNTEENTKLVNQAIEQLDTKIVGL